MFTSAHWTFIYLPALEALICEGASTRSFVFVLPMGRWCPARINSANAML